jgi:Uma2 family endonuclease
MSIAAPAASAASVTQRPAAATKARLYAAAGIADYWVVDLASQAVIVFRDPRGSRYETRGTFRDQATISPLALPTASLLPADLFPA